MEVLGSPRSPTWVKVKGLPLQAWHEGVFRLIGDCIGRTVELDEVVANGYIRGKGKVRGRKNKKTEAKEGGPKERKKAEAKGVLKEKN